MNPTDYSSNIELTTSWILGAPSSFADADYVSLCHSRAAERTSLDSLLFLQGGHFHLVCFPDPTATERASELPPTFFMEGVLLQDPSKALKSPNPMYICVHVTVDSKPFFQESNIYTIDIASTLSESQFVNHFDRNGAWPWPISDIC